MLSFQVVTGATLVVLMLYVAVVWRFWPIYKAKGDLAAANRKALDEIKHRFDERIFNQSSDKTEFNFGSPAITNALRAERAHKQYIAALLMKIIVSLAILASCLYIILSLKFPESDVKWAYGMCGTIIGHWFRR